MDLLSVAFVYAHFSLHHDHCFPFAATIADVNKYFENYKRADLPFGVTYKELGRMICKTPTFTQPLAQVFDNGSGTCVGAVVFLLCLC